MDMSVDMSATFDPMADYPWLSFRPPDLSRAPYSLWMKLGEIGALIDQISAVPLIPSYAEEMHKVFLAKGALATTAIEGNTLTEAQARQQLDGKLDLPPSQEYLAKEIANVLGALNGILDACRRHEPQALSLGRVCAFNGAVLAGLELADEDVVPGQIRHDSRGVGPYKAPPPDTCEYLLDRLCGWLEGPDLANPALDSVTLGFLKAVIAHLYLVWIHPFGDGNGRTARLIEFQILLNAGVPSPSAQLLSNHYNLTRMNYYLWLDKARRAGDGLTGFLLYAAEGFVDGLKTQIEMIRLQQWELAWQSYVREVMASDRTPKGHRQQEVMRHLGPAAHASEIPLLNPSLAAIYAGVSPKTLNRDLETLTRKGLLLRDDQGRYLPNRERLLAFFPFVVEPENSVTDTTPRN